MGRGAARGGGVGEGVNGRLCASASLCASARGSGEAEAWVEPEGEPEEGGTRHCFIHDQPPFPPPSPRLPPNRRYTPTLPPPTSLLPYLPPSKTPIGNSPAPTRFYQLGLSLLSSLPP